jgi:hypothetical protein
MLNDEQALAIKTLPSTVHLSLLTIAKYFQQSDCFAIFDGVSFDELTPLSLK